jgi:hypothetical protein
MGKINNIFSFGITQTDANDASNNYSIVAFIFVANVSTKLLPGNGREVHIQTHRLMGGIYELRGWDVLRCQDIHIPSFIKTG